MTRRALTIFGAVHVAGLTALLVDTMRLARRARPDLTVWGSFHAAMNMLTDEWWDAPDGWWDAP